ncbi:YbjN domain-containing protein [Nodosilinea nodulosa]|uniref:YbjN domain-containing protein n=1 Tax=Nodosilinea nodulosa TaxID=416001 RepID=UPI00036C1E6F|nr:YbjN domain-containing protein [Nodosilinea nodulosa]
MSEIDSNTEIQVSHVLDRYKNHLEFIGYLVEEDGETSIFAKHHRKENLRILKFGGDIGVLARLTYAFPARFNLDPIPLYIYANDLNNQFYFMKACVSSFTEGGYFLCMDSVLEGGYDRRNFSIFLDNIERDLNVFNDYIKTKDVFCQDEGGENS